MSANQTPIFVKSNRSRIVECPATTAARYMLFTPGADGSLVYSVMVRNPHSASVTVDLELNNGSSDIVLSKQVIPAYAGSLDTGVNVLLYNMLQNMGLYVYNKTDFTIVVPAGYVLNVSVPSHTTVLQFLTTGGDY